MIFVRRLVLLLLRFNINMRAVHIAGIRNVLAEALSRLQVIKFKRLAPWANPQPTEFPPLQPLLD